MNTPVGIIVLALLLSEAIALLYLVNKRKKEQVQYEEQDKLLTQYVAVNLDMEKELSDITDAYDRQQEMAAELQRIQQQIRLLKHDMKNHTLVILSYLDADNSEEAKRYAGEILDKLNRMYTYVNVGNSLLSYIINSKLSEAKELGIELKAEIENLPFSYMDSVDFSALLNNMLDNAIRGAVDSADKRLEVNIAARKGFDVITVKNSIDASVLEKNPTLMSSKEEPGHGYGLRQMKAVAEKYGGAIDIYEKNGLFVVSVLMAAE